MLIHSSSQLLTLSGVMGWFGYVVTTVYLFLAVAFGYFQFVKPSR